MKEEEDTAKERTLVTLETPAGVKVPLPLYIEKKLHLEAQPSGCISNSAKNIIMEGMEDDTPIELVR